MNINANKLVIDHNTCGNHQNKYIKRRWWMNGTSTLLNNETKAMIKREVNECGDGLLVAR